LYWLRGQDIVDPEYARCMALQAVCFYYAIIDGADLDAPLRKLAARALVNDLDDMADVFVKGLFQNNRLRNRTIVRN
jgi:hypothetical protein